MPPLSLTAVLFDWDGTLADSAEASFRCYVDLFASYNLPFDRDTFQRTYSPNWHRTYAAIGLPRESWDEADSRWLARTASAENAICAKPSTSMPIGKSWARRVRSYACTKPSASA